MLACSDCASSIDRRSQASMPEPNWRQMDDLTKRVFRFSVSLIVLFLALTNFFAVAAKDSPESLVAVGDVHGDFDDFVSILQRTGLIDKQNHWAGGKTTLVQLGDLLDRGAKPREVMDLMMSLEKQATEAGGRVVSLLGNHEMMNLMGDWPYVPATNEA